MSRLRADTLTDRTGTSAPDLTHGATSTTGTFSGDLGGGDVTLSGNASVDGTLTYQDADNINSTGIITAQQGIQVSANGFDVTGISTFNSPITVAGITTINDSGLHATGVVTATSFTGDGSGLTGTNRTVSLVASGTLSNGQTVIIQSDGTVKAVGIETGSNPVFGTKATFNTGGYSQYTSGVYDPDTNKVIIAYQKYVTGSSSDDAGWAVVGTVDSSDNSISFGTPVKFYSLSVGNIAVAYDSSNDKVVIAFHDYDTNYDERVIVGTVSGTSITFGSSVQLEGTSNANPRYTSIAFDSSNNKCVFCYRDTTSNNYYGTARVGTVSGNSISFGTAVLFNGSNRGDYIQATFDSSNNKVVIAFANGGSNYSGTAVVGTVSGTSISFGSAVAFESGAGFSSGQRPLGIAFDSKNNKVVIAYVDENDSNKGKAIVGTVSGTSISFGSAVEFNDSNHTAPEGIGAIYVSNAEKVVIVYRDAGNSNKGTAIAGTVSGTSISFGSEVVFNTAGGTNYNSAIYDSTNKRFVVAYRDDSNSSAGTAIVGSFDATNITSENFIGFSDAAYSDGDTATVQIITALDDAQSGLTTGSKHYVQNDGTLSTTAGSPSVLAGTAISDTEIIVKQ